MFLFYESDIIRAGGEIIAPVTVKKHIGYSICEGHLLIKNIKKRVTVKKFRQGKGLIINMYCQNPNEYIKTYRICKELIEDCPENNEASKLRKRVIIQMCVITALALATIISLIRLDIQHLTIAFLILIVIIAIITITLIAGFRQLRL